MFLALQLMSFSYIFQNKSPCQYLNASRMPVSRPFVLPKGQRAIVGEMDFEFMALLHHTRPLLVTDGVHIRVFCHCGDELIC